MTPPDASEQSSDDAEEDPFSIGTYVIDREDDDPNVAVVINRPPVTCEDWVAYYTPETGEVTVAEDNPGYDAEAPVIVVAFHEELEAENPEWSPEDGPFELETAGFKPYAFPPGRLEVVDPEEWIDDYEPETPGTDSEPRMAKVTPGGSPDDEGEGDSEAAADDGESEDAEAEEDEPEEELEPPEIEGAFADLRDRLAENATVEVRRGADGDAVLVVSKLGDEYEVHRDGTISGEGVLRSRLDGLVEEYLG